tara:strand:+ start:351 stop:659 length:309 start_codon:yes stop_codon:yes gene_type:complete
MGLIIYNDKKIQPQITQDFIVSSNHFYVFVALSIVAFLSFIKTKEIKPLIVYLVFLSIFLELFHLIIPERTFQWSDLFGNLLGVIVVIFINNLIKKYGVFKK